MSEIVNINKGKKRRRSKGKIFSDGIRVEKGKILTPIITIHYNNKDVKGSIMINGKDHQNEKRVKKSLLNDILSQFDDLKIFHEKSFTKGFKYEYLRTENGQVVGFKRKNTRKSRKNQIDPD